MELPLHWRMLRLEARWFIDVYERSQGMNPILLELAKLDYNMVQATYQEDLKHASMWWRSTRLPEKSSFSRDRLVENFLWAVGLYLNLSLDIAGECWWFLYTPCPFNLIEVGMLVLFPLSDGIPMQWSNCPQYMKICFLALYNFTNETAYDVLKEHDLNIIHISEMRSTNTSSCLFFITNPMTEEALGCLERFRDIIRWSSTIFRLSDDLGTSSDELKRGDVPKSIQCYMYETSASEDDARKYIGFLIDETWKKMNEERNLNSPFSQTLLEWQWTFLGWLNAYICTGTGMVFKTVRLRIT
ncbi:(-)-alpha-terpineol synthase [Vitis vinifera]|uniref:(-)-alpha-terpineol synthase n=1 Tax=Vitis vinifera TaxID=29760 RepID=A0A438CSW8_VITVI|nr:(-)-alpha-terpineol synthase [Vitis vinifera]